MPDPPLPRRPVSTVGSGKSFHRRETKPAGLDPLSAISAAHSPRYAELHCRTNFSFLRAASHPDELVQQAVELEQHALAITDRNSLSGVVRAHAAARETGLKLLIGSEITLLDGWPVILLAIDRAGYGRLSRLITLGRRQAAKGDCRLTFADVAAAAEGLIACVPAGGLSDPEENADVLSAGEGGLELAVARYREVFSDRCYLLAERHLGPDDARQMARLKEIGQRTGVPIAAANDVQYHEPSRRMLHDVLQAVRCNTTVAELVPHLPANAERFLKSPRQMARLFSEYPGWLERTIEVADRCQFSLDELRYEYPEELSPAGSSPMKYLAELTWSGAAVRYPQGIPPKVQGLIEHELQLIAELHYEAYFLTVWDLVQFARSRGILCQGRGSAANSAVCFCLGVTSVDPERIDVLFERFISKERNEAPDIDVDFEHERREEVLQYLYQKYGRDRAGMTAAYITYRPRSAVRDVGRALGLSLDRVDTLAKALEHHTDEDRLAMRFRETGFDPKSHGVRQFLSLVQQVLGFPRHLSQHVGGMVMTRGSLCELVPVENAAMPERTVIQWDKDDLDQLGVLKVDCLSLGMLTAIHRAFDLLEKGFQKRLTLASVPAEDPAVYKMIGQADTMGVFQIESRAQMSMLPRLRPRCFYDLVIEVAIVRPGPIQGDMVHPYLRRRSGVEAVTYPDDRIREVLKKTLGVPIFQEQAMRLAVVAAGFTPGEADQLRRAMGAWRRRGVIDEFRRKLIEGMLANGYSADFAERLFLQIRGFGEYGFPESHAASFALLVYVSAWLKCYYPEVFLTALLNSQPMGFYAAAQLVENARQHGVEVRPADVNFSDWDCDLEPGNASVVDEGSSQNRRPVAVRLGLRQVRGLSRNIADRIAASRRTRPFESFDDFRRRMDLPKAALSLLARSDAFGSLRVNRRDALWRSLPARESLPLFDRLEDDEPVPQLPEMSLQQEVIADYRSAGLSLRAHPFQFLRDELDQLGVTRNERLAKAPDGCRIKVSGLVLLRQRPGTASGITFVTLEDETGFANLIIRPEIWERDHRAARMSNALVVTGELQRQHNVIHVLVSRVEDLTPLLANLQTKSRDFQ